MVDTWKRTSLLAHCAQGSVANAIMESNIPVIEYFPFIYIIHIRFAVCVQVGSISIIISNNFGCFNQIHSESMEIRELWRSIAIPIMAKR